jgi:hypothetical protein
MQDESKVETVLVVKSEHDAQNRTYRYSTHEIPAHIAEVQLSRPDEKRNYAFRGARYATKDEADIYRKEQARFNIKPKKTPVIDEEIEEVAEVTQEAKEIKAEKKTKTKLEAK